MATDDDVTLGMVEGTGVGLEACTPESVVFVERAGVEDGVGQCPVLGLLLRLADMLVLALLLAPLLVLVLLLLPGDGPTTSVTDVGDTPRAVATDVVVNTWSWPADTPTVTLALVRMNMEAYSHKAAQDTFHSECE